MEDFWPEEFGEDAIKSPSSIMKEQASKLGRKTSYLLKARVDTSIFSEKIYHKFHIITSALDDYTYELFEVNHELDMYPLVINWEGYATGAKEVTNEDEFIQELKEIFNSNDTKVLFGKLIAQSK